MNQTKLVFMALLLGAPVAFAQSNDHAVHRQAHEAMRTCLEQTGVTFRPGQKPSDEDKAKIDVCRQTVEQSLGIKLPSGPPPGGRHHGPPPPEQADKGSAPGEQ